MDSLTVDLTGCTLSVERPAAPALPDAGSGHVVAFHVSAADFHMHGSPAMVLGSAAVVEVRGGSIAFRVTAASDGKGWLVPVSYGEAPRQGRLMARIHVAPGPLGKLAGDAAAEAARAAGVKIADVATAVGNGPGGTVILRVSATVSKLFVKTHVEVRATLGVVEGPAVRVMAVETDTDDGMVGRLARGFIESRAASHVGRTFRPPVAGVGGWTLESLELDASDGLAVSARLVAF